MSCSARIFSYIRNLIGLGGDIPSKRDSSRTGDGLSDDDETPAYDRHKLNKTDVQDILSSREACEELKPRTKKGTRLSRIPIPINVKHERDNGPSTSGQKPRIHTPIHTITHVIDDDEPEKSVLPPLTLPRTKKGTRLSRIPIPINVKHERDNGPSTSGQKPRIHTPIHTITHVIDDDEPEKSVLPPLTLPRTKKGTRLSRIPIPINVKHERDNGPSTSGQKPRIHTPIHTITHVIDDDEPEKSVLPPLTLPRTKKGTRLSRIPIPINVKHERDNGPSTSGQKPRIHTPIHTITHVIDDDEPEIIDITKQTSKKLPKIYIDLDDDNDTNENQVQEDEVQFVKKISTPPPNLRFFAAPEPADITLSRMLNGRNFMPSKSNSKFVAPRNSMPSKSISKFVAPPGITKSYKKGPVVTRSMNLPLNRRSTMSKLLNLDEKLNFQELISKSKLAESMKPAGIGRPLAFTDLTDESTLLRNTPRTQRRSLNEIHLVEKGLIAGKENDSATNYDPLIIATLNSEVEVVPTKASTSSSNKFGPINTLRNSLRDVAGTSTDSLSKIDSKYKKKKQLTQVKLADAKRESDIISKVNSEQKIAQLEHKLKYKLSIIPESIYEERQPTVELPSLTPDQDELVNQALAPGPPNSLLIHKFNLSIHKCDIETLAGLNWLNDQVINFYMNLLMQRSQERSDLPKVYACNTFFYPKLMQSGHAALRRWTRKIDIFSHDLMLIPIHHGGVHWCLIIIDFRGKTISYLDSMGGNNGPCLQAVTQYLNDEHHDKKGKPFDDKHWKSLMLKDIPQQMNVSDCGTFASTFAEFSARNAPYTFNQSHMPYLRRKMVLEIITGKLLL